MYELDTASSENMALNQVCLFGRKYRYQIASIFFRECYINGEKYTFVPLLSICQLTVPHRIRKINNQANNQPDHKAQPSECR